MESIRRITPLKRAIFESGMTQRAVAAAAGLSEGQLSRIVNGLHASEAVQHKLAEILRRAVSDLFPESHTPEVCSRTDGPHAARVGGDLDEAA